MKMKFDTTSMLKMLSDSLYDTPLVLLRENLQNAYDAILMRMHFDESFKNPEIRISIDNDKITFKDNGIGMTEQEVEKNFWTAGCSGKNNADAKAAGVVGTFGIGAFANFGVCETLELTTQKFGTNKQFTCTAHRNDLENICSGTEVVDSTSYGTTITITIKKEHYITVQRAVEYLTPYVKYIQIPVYVNEEKISCQDYRKEFVNADIKSVEKLYNDSKYKLTYCIRVSKTPRISGKIYVKDIIIDNKIYQGDILLDTNQPSIWGLRNGFGLSILPLNSVYRFGGLINLDMLIPTAGREAVNKSCVAILQRLVGFVETLYTDYMAETEIADSCREFLMYLNNHFEKRLAKNVKIQIANDDREFVTLGSLIIMKEKVRYYKGTDNTIPGRYASGDISIVIVSKDNPRKSIQLKFLTMYGFQEIEDRVQVKPVSYEDMDYSMFAIGHKIQSIVKDDYLIMENEVKFADISHNVSIYVEEKENKVNIYIDVNNAEIKTLKNIYNDNYNIFESVMKDYVRNYIYQQISPYIPSSKKEGIKALTNLLNKKNEVFSIERDDMESIDRYFELYQAGKITEMEFVSRINRNNKSSRETVNTNNVKSIETVFPEVLQSPPFGQQKKDELSPMPPILKLDVETKAKLLTTETNFPSLHGYKKFLAFTGKMTRDNYSFFFTPHTTKVIWSMHRIIYIFTLNATNYTLYYDMELKKHLDSNLTGGEALETTTIITKDKIYIPIHPSLENYFCIKEEPLKFNIHYDSIDEK